MKTATMKTNRPPKQIIIMRKDLGMRKGKMIAQGAHASLAVLKEFFTFKNLSFTKLRTLKFWLSHRFTKVTLSVDSEDELMEIYQNALNAGLVVALITDAGLTEFNGIPTRTCLAIGPEKSSDVDPISGHLKLL